MIDFHRLELGGKRAYDELLMACPPRGCEYSFANLYFWGLQKIAYFPECAVFFSHFRGRSVYPYPIGTGNKREAVERVLQDARERGLPCRFVCLSAADTQELESWFPGKFLFSPDRDGFDYVYDINDLADLKGRKYQKKRNHLHRFWDAHPDAQVQRLAGDLLEQGRHFAARWYQNRKQEDPHGDYLLEEVAMGRAFRHFDELGLEGIALTEGNTILALTIGSPLSADTYDIHFEKADEEVEGAYAAVNQAFAQYLQDTHPELRYLNREDDMGLAGLRKAKLSYCPHHMEEKYWAYRWDEGLGEDDNAF